jgi:8-oxo-dGTP pyrophosphatase MutT (NUDIX family)
MLNRKDRGDGLCWVFPGGKIEPHEAPVPAGRREVFEEAGVLCKRGTKIASRTHPTTKQHVVYIRYDYDRGECRVREPDKFVKAVWVTPDEIENELGVDVYPEVMKSIRAQAKRCQNSAVGRNLFLRAAVKEPL